MSIPTESVTVESGAQWAQLYAQSGARKLMLVGGASISVGVGGYLTGGGHGPLSSLYGLGADNVLEMEVVTPDAKLIVANECQNSDYFWALRGVRTILCLKFLAVLMFAGRWCDLWCGDQIHHSCNANGSNELVDGYNSSRHRYEHQLGRNGDGACALAQSIIDRSWWLYGW